MRETHLSFLEIASLQLYFIKQPHLSVTHNT
uniref:Uncharacterized protein n=1 Tax=Anguilla anguilla TaxID=7936 RepID=A0A0E9SG05_ANGAN